MKKLMQLSFLALLIASVFGISSCGNENIKPSPELSVVSPPNPNVFPVFLMMKDNPELTINLTTVTSGSKVPPYFQSGEADITTIYSYIMAKHVINGNIPDLQLRAITLWDNFYIVAGEGVTSLADLVGKTIIITGPNGVGENGPADKIMQAAILRAGYQLTDFNLKYQLIDEAMEDVKNGVSEALLLAEPAATGFIANSIFGNSKLTKAINLQQILDGYSSWEANKLPLGGVATLPSYDTPEKAQAVEDFVAAYKVAANHIMENKMSSAITISNGLKTYYGITFPWPIVLRSLNEGTLVFDSSLTIADMQPELNSFITELVGKLPTTEFYRE